MPTERFPNGTHRVRVQDSNGTPLDVVLDGLEGLIRTGEDRWGAKCPAHQDRKASLVVSEGQDGRVLVHCHAGCHPEDIVRELGLTMSDLFEKNPSARRPDGQADRSRIAATYDYYDEKGVLLFQVVRYEPKDFRQRRPDGKGGWIWGLGNNRRVLYRLPELLGAAVSEPVFVVEGERDVESLWAQHIVATANPGGAGKWRPEYSTALRGRQVVVVPDADPPGRKHAEQVATALRGIAASVKVLELPGVPHKGDVSDWLAAGGTREGLLQLAGKAPEFGREEMAPAAGVLCLSDVQPKDVVWLWPGRLPAGMVTVLDGPPGAGKSTIVVDIVARLTTGRPLPNEAGSHAPADVVLLGHEDSPEHTIRPRLDAAGADARRVHLLQDVGGRMPRLPDDGDAIERVVRETGARLVVIDPISAYIGSSDMHRDNEVRAALAPLVIMAERTGATVLMLRHLRKSGGTDAIYRGLGSVAITALARAGLMLLTDPDDDGARILAWPKMSVAAPPKSLRWRWAGGEGAPRVVWEGVCELSANDILAHQDRAHGGGGDEAATAVDHAEEWLMRRLEEHGEAPAAELFAQAKQESIAEMTLRRAARRLGVKPRQVAANGKRGGRWVWAAPTLRGGGVGQKNDPQQGHRGEQVPKRVSPTTCSSAEPGGDSNYGPIKDLVAGEQILNEQLVNPPVTNCSTGDADEAEVEEQEFVV